MNIVLLPLYRPQKRHLLLIKSLLSACNGVKDVVVWIGVDGPDACVEWPGCEVESIMSCAQDYGVALKLLSYRERVGYPASYQVLGKYALGEHGDDSIVYFVDQDDYCLPNRLKVGSADLVCVSSAVVVNDSFLVDSLHVVGGGSKISLFTSPAPGMTYSVPADVFRRYLALCDFSPLFAGLPHDYLIYLVSLMCRSLCFRGAPNMIYIQHGNNVVGYDSGLRRYLARIRSMAPVVRRRLLRLRVLFSLRDYEPLCVPKDRRENIHSNLRFLSRLIFFAVGGKRC